MRRLVILLLFGVSFGYVEAAVVIDLRTIFDPLRNELYREVPHNSVFPLPSMEQVYEAEPQYFRVLQIEQGRELATIVMLAAVGMLFGQTFRQWLAGFALVFGVWDLSYYAFLKILIGWPASLLTWDLVFLLPVPMVAPVIAPVLMSLSLIVAGGATLWRESRGRPVHFGRLDCTLLVIAGLVVIVAFGWDFRHTMAGGWPNPFNWPLFALGGVTVIIGFTCAFLRRAS